MTTAIRILTTSTLDSSPSVLLVASDGSKTLVNCGEACQRAFLEASSSCGTALRVRSVKRICLTHMGHDAVAGLPGMILTTADVVADSALANSLTTTTRPPLFAANSQKRPRWQDKDRSKSKMRQSHFRMVNGKADEGDNDNDDNDDGDDDNDLTIVGPVGTRSFLDSLRHFMRREKFSISLHEGDYSSGTLTKKKQPKRKRQKKGNDDDDDKSQKQAAVETSDGIQIQSLCCERDLYPWESGGSRKPIASFLFSTPPLPGRFLPDKAMELGLPPGPLYGQLKGGTPVTITKEADGTTLTIRPEQVLEPSSPGVAVFLAYCPTLPVLTQLQNHPLLAPFSPQEATPNDARRDIGTTLDVMIHMTPPIVFYNPLYQSWLQQKFGPQVNHITLFVASPEKLGIGTGSAGGSTMLETPFRSVALGALRRSFLSPTLFPSPLAKETNASPNEAAAATAAPPDHVHAATTAAAAATTSTATTATGAAPMETTDQGQDSSSSSSLTIIPATPFMEYILIPRTKRGVVANAALTHGIGETERQETQKAAWDSGAVPLAQTLLPPQKNDNNNNPPAPDKGELVFTGTGAALPSKHRNVSGIYLRDKTTGAAMLLDVGEGTTGQLLRHWSLHRNDNDHDDDDDDDDDDLFYQQRLRDICAVWISHPHADHHLGLIRLLSERKRAVTLLRQREEEEKKKNAKKNGSKGSNAAEDTLLLIAPPPLFRFLQEYAAVDASLAGSYWPLDCRDVAPTKTGDFAKMDFLRRTLGITAVRAVSVAHCAFAFGVVLDGTPFGRVCYSGDCRPSDALAAVGKNADLLIHEATFEDGMEAEALVKNHCTVREALSVGRKMEARSIVLTHFSQRYPKIPPLPSQLLTGGTNNNKAASIENLAKDDNDNNDNDDNDCKGMANGHSGETVAKPDAGFLAQAPPPVVFAFDHMVLTPRTIPMACVLTPALRLLYPEKDATSTKNDDDDDDDDSNDDDDDTRKYNELSDQAKEALSKPGAFAVPGVI